MWKLRKYTIAKTILKKNKKLENSHFDISKLQNLQRNHIQDNMVQAQYTTAKGQKK